MVTLYPLDCKRVASEADTIPFPKEEVTPPVTNMYLVEGIYKAFPFVKNAANLLINGGNY